MILLILLPLYAGLIYIMMRTISVQKFRIKLLQKISTYLKTNPSTTLEMIEEYFGILADHSTFKKMVYSFKPLKEENWIPPHILEKLNS